MKQYVIAGNGTAAAGCIEGIRSVDTEGKIIVISAEKHPVYCRPLISYYLEGKTDQKKMMYRDADFYDKNGCEVLYGKSAVKLDPAEKTVTLDDGKKISYDSFCDATGSSPFVPPFEGLENVRNKFSFMTIDDALAIEKAITPESDVLIVGAGLIGLKCAEGICGKVKSITVCDLAERVLSSILDNECAALMQKSLEDNGVAFMLSDTAVKFSEKTAYMKSGKKVRFDVLILAVGVRANISLVKDAGGACGRGITVNEKMQTSLSDVYAAGDCTECHDISCDETRVIAILPNAYMQGHCAGRNMAGKETVFDNSIPMNSIGFFGVHAMTAGSYPSPDKGGKLYEEKGENSIKRLYVKDNLLTGFIIIGKTEKTGIYTNLIRNRIPLDTVDFEALKKSPALSAFSHDYRKKNLGGVV